MRRHLALLDHALGSLRRRRARSVALIVGLGFLVAVVASVVFLADALRHEVALGLEAQPDLTVQRLVAGRPALIDASGVDAIRALPAVRSVEPRVWGYLFLPALSANVTVVGTPPGVASRRLHGTLREGRAPARDGELAVGAELAALLGVRSGDRMAFPTQGDPRLLTIVGVIDEASSVRSADLIVATEADARLLLSVPAGLATDLAVELTTADEARIVSEHILERVPGARVLDKRLQRRSAELTFDGRAGLVSVMLLPALCALLLLAWDRLTGLSEAERREIGVLKAIGWETSDVLTARIWESALVSAAGAVLGVLAAYLYVFLAGAPGLYGALLGWSALYPPLQLAPRVDAAQVLTLVGAVIVPFVGVGIVPAWRAAVLDPDRAMRGDA